MMALVTQPAAIAPAPAPAPALLERDDALAELGRALAAVTQRRQGHVVLVSGEAGAGKTALLRRFCDTAPGSVDVRWAWCDPLFTPRPLGPLLDLADELGGDLSDQIAAGAAPHEVAASLLSSLDRRRPSVVVIDDVHWADEATLDVIRLLTGRARGVPLLLVVSYRSDEVTRTGPLRLLLGELPHNELVARVEVPPLSLDAVTALAEPAGVDPGELFARTGGNPFFVTEVLGAAGAAIPDTIRDAVLARSARLSEPARSLLDAVAVVPGRTEVWLLDALAAVPAGTVDECLGAGMLTADGDSLAFRHELARLALEESLPPDRRVELHRRAVGALDGRPGLARLAHHAEGAGDAEAVLRFAVAAAEEATALGAHREAAEQYARALRFGAGLAPEDRAVLLERYAAECYLTDMRSEGMDALAEAIVIHRASGDRRRTAGALLARSRPLSCAGRGKEAAAAVREAAAILESVGSGAELAELYREECGTAMMDHRVEDAVRWGTRAIELAEAAGDHATLIGALNSVGTARLLGGDDEGLAMLERSLALALELDRPADA